VRNVPFGRALIPALAVAALLLPLRAAAQQGKAHVEQALVTDDKNELTEKISFPASTGTIYVYAMFDELPAAAKVSVAWIALKTDQLDDNSRFHETTKSMGPGTFQYFFNFKPAKTWPIGTYRVDLLINGRVEKSLSFRVTK
jgi:hypothetical protein